MGISETNKNYRNFSTVIYFIAQAAANITREELEKQLAFFERHMKIDKVYLETYRGGIRASKEQIGMCREVFERHGVKVSGGITTTCPHREGMERKTRLFNTLCYNDPAFTDELADVCRELGEMYDEFIIDDFFFTNCACAKCREEKEKFNKERGITDGSWESYRLDLMRRVSEKYVIAPAKKANPNVSITIKYPNWAESYQETGYNPAEQRKIFDNIYTGTETREPNITSQHLPRYLSYSLMTYMENMWEGHNGGGWFDPYDLYSTEQYLEQAYLTAFSKPKEMMMFCFQSLYDTMNVPALGYQYDKLDSALDHVGKPTGIMCYLPDNCQGEDNIQDFLGMCGLPIVCTPYFPENAEKILLTRSSAYDSGVTAKLEKYLCGGGTAIVTSGFVEAAQDKGIRSLSSVRFEGRRAAARDFLCETVSPYDGHGVFNVVSGREEIGFRVPEFRNNSTWALIKAASAQENFGILLLDICESGRMLTLTVPDVFSSLYAIPPEVLGRIRKECSYNGVWFEGKSMTSIFMYDNDTFILYRYADNNVYPDNIRLHVKGARGLSLPMTGEELRPLYTSEDDAVFELRTDPGKYTVYSAVRQ